MSSSLASDHLAPRLNDVLRHALIDRVVGAVVLVCVDGERRYAEAAGWADREAERPMREDAIFRLASLTKPVVTVAALRFIERGEIGLDDPVTRWLPDFRPRLPNGETPVITVRQLLTHTAGLGYGFLQPETGPYHRLGVSDGLDQPGLGMAEELRRLAQAPLLYPPGTAWAYSLAMDVMGAVLERAGDAPLDDVMAREVTGPLGMADTAFSVKDEARLATPYMDARPPRRMTDPDVAPLIPGLAGIRFCPSRIFDAGSFPSGGGGMAGSARDFMALLETLRAGGAPLLKAETVHAMMTNQIGDLRITTEPTPAWGFGYGGAVLMDAALNGGPRANGVWKWSGVYGHHWYVDPNRRMSVVALTNTALEGLAGSFVAELLAAVYAD